MHKLATPKYEYTHQNHLRYEFENSAEDILAQRKLFVEIGSPTRELFSFKAEAVAAAKLIYEKMPKPIILCLSSGVDSQCMYSAFAEAGVPFEIASFRYNWLEQKNLNHADRIWTETLRNSGRTFHEIDLDLNEFYYGSEHWSIADESQCSSPQLTCHMKCMSLLPGTPILSWNIPHVFLNAQKKPALFFPYSKYFSYHRFFLSREMPAVAFFFLYTPELFYSSLYLENIRESFYQYLVNPDIQQRQNKVAGYKEGGFQFEYLPKQKLTGFEKFKQVLASHTGGPEHTYDLLFRQPLEAKFPFDEGINLRMSAKVFNEAFARSIAR